MKGLYCCILLFASFTISFGQATGDFRSFQTGNWNDVNTWERFDGASWVNPAPSTPTSASGVITVQHIVSVTANVTADQLSVSSTGQININSSMTLSVAAGSGTDLIVSPGGVISNQGTISIASGFGGSATVVVDGTFNNSGTINGASTTRLTFASGSTYDHQRDAGVVPTATWDAASLCKITGSTSAGPTGLNQTFGNFTWNTPGLSAGGLYNAGLSSTSIFNGDFRIEGTGADLLVLSDETATISFNAGFVVTGSSVFAVTNLGAITADIAGDFTYSSTADSYFSNTGTGNVTVAGDFLFSSGRFFIFDPSGTGTLTFDGTVAQTFTDTGGSFDGDKDPSITISGSDVSIIGEGAFDGSGDFTLKASSILRVGSLNSLGALQSGTTAGNIRISGTRNYEAGSTLIYNGSSAQFAGSGHPTTSNINTTINNASGVTLAANLTITGNLTLASGNLSLGSNTLTLGGNFTPNANFLNVTSSSNLTINGTGAFGSLAITGSTTINNFTINRTSAGTVTLGTALTIAGTFTQTDGDLILNGNTLTLNGAYSRTAGNVAVDNSSSVIIGGSGTLSAISFSGSALNTFTLNRASATVSTGASLTITNLNLTSGTFDNSGTITMASGGTITRTAQGSMSTAPGAVTSYNVVYNIANDLSTGVELPTGASQLNNLTKEGSAILTLSGAITVNGTLTFTSGTFNSSNHALDIKGNLVSNATSQLTSSAITFSGTTTIDGGTPPTFGSITVSGAVTPLVNYRVNGNLANSGTLNAGSVTTTFGGTTTISGTSTSAFNHLVIAASSTLTASTGSMNVAGNFTNNGTFDRNGGTVVFNGTSSIGGTSSTDFANITISGTLNAPATLNVTRNFINNGLFNRGTGTVVFKGTSKQSISGSAVTDFNNINVTNTAGPPAVEVLTNQNLRGTLTLAGGSQFDADGSGSVVFTLISASDDPTSDAGIATLPSGASVTGNVTVQRYMAIEGSTDRIYRYISSPVQSAAVSQIQSEIPVTGTFTGTSTCSGCGTNQSMFSYNEAIITGDLNTGYEDFPASANTETLASGRGYAIYVRGNVDPVLSAGSARWDVRNPINSGTVNYPVSFNSSGDVNNDGWNLIGNPYPSTIDWNASTGWSKSSAISGTIYMKDNGNSGIYATWNGTTSVNGGSRYIAMGQAFWVKSDGSGSTALSSTESVKTAGTQTTFFREQGPSNLLRITLRRGDIRDESVIHFRQDATEDYDRNADAYKLRNQTFNLSSLASGDLKLAINSLPELTCGTTVKLDISDVLQGSYLIEFSQFETFSDEVEISVYDVFTDTKLDARAVNSYAFEVTSDSSSFGDDRFSVSFSYKTPVEASIDFSPEVCKGQEAVLMITNSETFVNYSLYKNDVAVTEAVAGNGGSLNIPLDASILASGDNNLILRYSPAGCSSMVSSKQVNIKAIDLPDLTTTDGSYCGNGKVTLAASGAEEGNYRWYETETDNVLIAGESSSTYLTPLLSKSKTYYVSAVNALGCEGARKPVMAVVHQYDEVVISVNDEQDLLTSSYETGNQWYFNGVAIPGATGKTVEVSETGLFEVEVKVNGCATRASREMIVLGVGENAGSGVRFFPNPVVDKFSIALGHSDEKTEASMYSSFGKVLGAIRFISDGSGLKGEYNFQDHPPGIYFIRLKQGNKTVNYKIIKK